MGQSQPQSKRFRLPAAVYLSRSPLAPEPSSLIFGNSGPSPTTPSGFVPLAIGTLAQSLAVLAPAPEGSGQRMLLEHIHQFIGQPALVMETELPLQAADVTFALQILLSTLNPILGDRHAVTSTVQSEAGGLATTEFHLALQRLSGVGIVCSEDWGADQRQAVSQAILEAKLVEQASQIDFVDEAIAALRSVLHDAQLPLQVPETFGLKAVGDQAWTGPTLVVVRGSSLLHLAIITLTADRQQMQRHQILLDTLPMDDKLKLMVEHLQHSLSTLFQAAALRPEAVQNVLYADDVEPSPAIAHWLKKQVPGAVHVGDGDRPSPRIISRFAYGAAIQSLYTQQTSHRS